MRLFQKYIIILINKFHLPIKTTYNIKSPLYIANFSCFVMNFSPPVEAICFVFCQDYLFCAGVWPKNYLSFESIYAHVIAAAQSASTIYDTTPENVFANVNHIAANDNPTISR